VHIALKVIGGFTGRAGAEVHEVDVDRLPEDDARRLRGLVDAAGISSLPETIKKSAPASWDFLYELTLQDERGSRSLRFHLDAAPAELRTLAEAVIAAAKEEQK